VPARLLLCAWNSSRWLAATRCDVSYQVFLTSTIENLLVVQPTGGWKLTSCYILNISLILVSFDEAGSNTGRTKWEDMQQSWYGFWNESPRTLDYLTLEENGIDSLSRNVVNYVLTYAAQHPKERRYLSGQLNAKWRGTTASNANNPTALPLSYAASFYNTNGNHSQSEISKIIIKYRLLNVMSLRVRQPLVTIPKSEDLKILTREFNCNLNFRT